MAVKAIDPKGSGDVVQIEEIKPRSLLQLAARRYLRHRMAMFGTALMLSIVLFVTVGALFVSEAEGNEPCVATIDLQPGTAVNPDAEDVDPKLRLCETENMVLSFIFGGDPAGRNVFVRTIYGGQISLAIGLTSVAISITLGTAIGMVAGFFGGIVDSILSRITEMFLSIPALILLLVLSTVFAKNTTTVNIFGRELSQTVVYIVLLIGFTSWMPLSRIVRSQVLSLKEQEFVVAARAIGVGNASIIMRHLLPNLVAPIVVAATLGIGTAIITEAYLSFLGFGVQPPTATWGNIINGARGEPDSLWWLWMFPGGLLVATVLAINFIGDGLNDALNPRAVDG